MHKLAVLLAGLVLGACSAPMAPPASPPAEASEPQRPAEPTPSEAGELLTALELLECDAGPSDVGGSGEDVAIDGGGETPDEALAAFLANTVFVIPRAGYERIGQSGDRHAYAYRSDGEIKVVVVVSPRFGEMVGTAFTADELRACPEPEFGAMAQFGEDRRTWSNATTGRILTDIPGPGHCGWESARMLHVLNPDGSLGRQYLRDPLGVFDDIPSLLDTYAEGVDLPADASDSGYRSPEGYELFFSEADTAAYVVTPGGTERWPRAEPPIGCS